MRLGLATVLPLLAAMYVLAIPARSAETPKLQAYGEHLSAECFVCHRRDGSDDGIPPIVGMSVNEMMQAMSLYRSGLRTNEVMVSIASSLDEKQWHALAVYLATLKKTNAKAK